jgi:hypothetical protein
LAKHPARPINLLLSRSHNHVPELSELGTLQPFGQVIRYHLLTWYPLNVTLTLLLSVRDKKVPDVDVAHPLPAGCPTIALLRRAPLERTLVFHISLFTAKITQDKLQQFYQNDKKIISVNFKTGILRLILFYYLIRLNKRRHFQNRTIKLHMLVFNK